MYPNTLLCLLFLHRECCRFFGDDGLTPRVFFTKVAPFGLLWLLTNYLYLQALRKINTTDASALFCCNKAFVFLLSWIVLRDRFMGVRVSPSVSGSSTRHVPPRYFLLMNRVYATQERASPEHTLRFLPVMIVSLKRTSGCVSAPSWPRVSPLIATA